jgi:predicted DNA-binding ribbon-helix-helix protein
LIVRLSSAPDAELRHVARFADACVILATLSVKWYSEGLIIGSISQIEGASMKSPVLKRSIVVAGHKTSVSLEDAFWSGLKEIAGRRLMTLSGLVGAIDKERQHTNLSSALRLFVLDFYHSQVSDIEPDDQMPETMERPSAVS